MRILVTGATSQIGDAIVRQLLDRGDHVATLQRSSNSIHAVRQHRGSVADPAVAVEAVAGCDAVVHLAARVGIVGSWDQFHLANVTGTEVMVKAAEAAGVTRFVHVSSPSVAHGGDALVAAHAAPADPVSARGHYSRSKAMAERVALAANGANMSVVAIRPHLVWGPDDAQLVGRIVERARAGRVALVGTGASLIDSTYIDNAADALVAAVDHCEAAKGRALVISNGEPRPIGELVNGILAAHRLDPVTRRVPKVVAFGAGWVAERAWPAMKLSGEPPMTSFLAEQLGTAHWFDQREARALLRWTPRVGLDEGLRLLKARAD